MMMDKSLKEASGLTVAGQTLDGTDAALHVIEKFLTVPAAKQAAPAFESDNAKDIRALENPIARQIIDAMRQSGQARAYATAQELSDEILFRLHAIRAASFCNTGQYDMDYFNPDIGLEPRIGSTDASRLSRYWAFLNPSDEWDAEFVQTAGTRASEAMAPVQGATFPFRGECAGAFQMYVYYGLLTGLGAARFDQMADKFGTMYVGPWRLEDGTPNPATLYMQSAPLSDPPIPGDYMYFKNKDDYLKWAPDGFWTGLNAMYVGKDALGTRHYSGMGASWLSETNLRASLVNAYYHDCSPHTIDDPHKEVRFTLRNTLTIPANLETMTNAPSGKSSGAGGSKPDAALLGKAGFAEIQPGVFHHSGTTLGALAQDLGFDPAGLRQVPSAGLDNPPHRITQHGVTTIVHYTDAAAGRRDPDAQVSAHVNLNAQRTKP